MPSYIIKCAKETRTVTAKDVKDLRNRLAKRYDGTHAVIRVYDAKGKFVGKLTTYKTRKPVWTTRLDTVAKSLEPIVTFIALLGGAR